MRQGEFLRRDVLKELIMLGNDFDVTPLPSLSDTQGSQMPNVTVPLLFDCAQTAEWQQIHRHGLQHLPLNAAEQHLSGMSLQRDEARLLRRRG